MVPCGRNTSNAVVWVGGSIHVILLRYIAVTDENGDIVVVVLLSIPNPNTGCTVPIRQLSRIHD